MTERTYIELFAGCGGLSLGLSSLRYKRLLANELSPMAAETYAYNFLATDLTSEEFRQTPLEHREVLWLSTAYTPKAMRQRLNENPLERPNSAYCDLECATDVTGRLIVGNIIDLNEHVARKGSRLTSESPDIVSGGPPCQSFSMAGLRQYDNQRNRLPWEFAKFVASHEPKLVVLENVSGILHPFNEQGRKVYAWFEVAKAFAKIGYAPICLHVNAVRVGVAQNRPRFLMFAVREDLVEQAESRLGEDLLVFGRELLDKRDDDVEFDRTKHTVIDLRDDKGPAVLRAFFNTSEPVSVSDAIDDLSDGGGTSSAYVTRLTNEFASVLKQPRNAPKSGPFNHAHRHHTGRVKARFRVYQTLATADDPELSRIVLEHLRPSKDVYGARLPGLSAKVLLQKADPLGGLIDEHGRRLEKQSDVQEALQDLETRKHSQRSLIANKPAPAALSIPDDACHYRDVRTLTVREMARIQSFPDQFILRSTPTTGGKRRRFQVPQYTQVGNAVPPKLGRAIGEFADVLLGDS